MPALRVHDDFALECWAANAIGVMPRPLTFIFGCTGSGKGSLGRELARRTGGQIISIDSMKVYRRMDIGTAKPSRELRREIPHHLIDVAEPSEEFSVAHYVEHADRAITEIRREGSPIFVVGGTPMYVKALMEGLFEGPGADSDVRARLHEVAETRGERALFERLERIDPEAARRIHPNDKRRIVRALEVFELTGKPISQLQAQWDQDRTRYEAILIGIRRPREEQSGRINLRVRRMIEHGLVGEVTALLAEPEPLSTTARKALGYAEIARHLRGEVSLAEAIELIKINTRRLAKAQRTWFRRFRDVDWIDVKDADDPSTLADALMDRRGELWTASPR